MIDRGRISVMEFAAVLILLRVFSEATSLPGEYVYYGMQRFTVVAVSFAMTAAAYIPMYYVSANLRYGGDIGAFSCNRALHGFMAALLTVYMLFEAAGTGLRAHYYASSTVFDSAPSWYFYVFTGIAMTAAIFAGTQAASRTGLIVFSGLLLLFVLMVAALAPEINTDRLYPAAIDDADNFAGEVLREFSLNSEFLIFGILCGSSGRGTKRVIPLYLGISCAMILFMTLLYNTVFGCLTSKLDYPFYTLSSVSDITLLHRINGIDVMVWVMAAVLKVTFYAFAFRGLMQSRIRSETALNIAASVFAAAALILSWVFTKMPELFTPIKAFCDTGVPLFAAALLTIPTALVVHRRKKEAERA